MLSNQIHPTAVIGGLAERFDKSNQIGAGAVIGETVELGPGNLINPQAVIDGSVRLGQNNTIGPGAVIIGPVELGDDNWIGAGVVIGGPPEIRGFIHDANWLTSGSGAGIIIGHRNIIRELVTVQQGSRQPTRIADECFIMASTYIAHDVEIAQQVTLSAHTSLAGHVRVGPLATCGMQVNVHQFRVIGPLVMLGMGAVVTHDIPPGALAHGCPARILRANQIGLDRAGWPTAASLALDQHYRSGADQLPAGWQPPVGHTWFNQWWETAVNH